CRHDPLHCAKARSHPRSGVRGNHHPRHSFPGRVQTPRRRGLRSRQVRKGVCRKTPRHSCEGRKPHLQHSGRRPMTSGEFRALPVSSIIVDREGRQRRELRGIDELAASIAARGLIHPIIVTRDGNLVAGERRLTAVRSLGWTHIPVQFVDEVDPNELRAIELEENVKRVDLTWQEQCLAVAAYHEARQAMEKDWTVTKTADALGVSESFVTRQSQVAEALRKGNTRVAEADRYSTALNIVQREAERARASKLEALDRLVEERPIERTAPLLNADFTQWAEIYDGPPFNFIHCDFPYGINAPGHGQLADRVLGEYDDSPEVYDALCGALDRKSVV